MEAAAGTDVDNLSVAASGSYPDHGGIVENPSGNQSVVSTITHGTHGTQGSAGAHPAPTSPARSGTTPLNASPPPPAEAHHIALDVMGGLEPMPNYSVAHSHVEYSLPPHQQEQERQNPFDLHLVYDNASRERSNPVSSSDDELTEPSTSANTGENTHATIMGSMAPLHGVEGQGGGEAGGFSRSDAGATSTFGRLVQSAATKTKGSLSRSNTDRKASADEGDFVEGALIYGYLQKLGRNNKWQTRWFETDGECLTYYKSSKRLKLLATLDLAKVGSIVINHEDTKGCCFTINISERPYHLKADSRAACKDWVIMLNRVKEARMQEGNVKIVSQPPDLLDDHDYTPRVVVVANRQRTHAVEDEDLASWEAGGYGNHQVDAAVSDTGGVGGTAGKYAVGAAASNRLARWQKPSNALSKWASKVLAWARSLRNHGCTDAENQVVLDHHLHPPGHDDPVNAGGNKTIQMNPSATNSWSKASSSAGRGLMPRSNPPINVTVPNRLRGTDFRNPGAPGSPSKNLVVDDEDETRELS